MKLYSNMLCTPMELCHLDSSLIIFKIFQFDCHITQLWVVLSIQPLVLHQQEPYILPLQLIVLHWTAFCFASSQCLHQSGKNSQMWIFGHPNLKRLLDFTQSLFCKHDVINVHSNHKHFFCRKPVDTRVTIGLDNFSVDCPELNSNSAETVLSHKCFSSACKLSVLGL